MSIELAEKILHEKFKKEPFHNLYLLNNIEPTTTKYGGTCSDKTLSYLAATRKAGLSTYLHSANINGENMHRLVRFELAGKRYFIDPGNGWPSIKVYSASEPIEYESYGMGFRTEIKSGVLTVFHRRLGIEKVQMQIDIKPQSEQALREDIANRFAKGIKYPFDNEVRFSMIIDGRFLFIRGSELEVYSSNGLLEVHNIPVENLRDLIEEYFEYDVNWLFLT
jgi:hypothetical protein